MFQQLRLHGKAGTLLWGYRTAARITEWRMRRQPADRQAGTPAQWVLSGRIEQIDPYQMRQRPLLFTAETTKGFGGACPIVGDVHVEANHFRAIVGPPEKRS